MVLARFLGAGMFALGLACLKARNDVGSPAGFAVVYGMTSYNLLSAVLVTWAIASVGLGGLILMAAALTHAVFGILLVRGLMVVAKEQAKAGG